MISIRSITMKNFRGHKDTSIEISDGEGVFFISGNNGGGKTTLINAINWCLFGDIAFNTIYDGTDTGIRTKGIDNSEPVEVRVVLEGLGHKYQLKRVATDYDERGKLSTLEIDSGNSRELSDNEAEALIKKILPKNIRGLFFLNGDNFSTEIFNRNSTNGLKSNIYKVSELDTISNAIRHLGLAENLYLKSIDKTTRDYNKIQELTESKEFSTKKIEEIEDDIKHANDKIREHEQELEDFDKLLASVAEIQDIIKDRDRLQDDLKDAESRLANDEADITECIQKSYHKVLLLDEVEEYRKALNKAEDDGKIPSPVDPKVTNNILETGVCLCGRCIGEEERVFIKKQHERYEAINKLKFLTDGILIFADIKDRIKDSYYVLADAINDKDKLDSKISGLKDRLDEVLAKLNGVNVAMIPNNPALKRQHIKEDIEKWKIRVRGYAQAKIEHENEITRCNKELQRLLGQSGDKDTQKLMKELEHIRELQQILKTLLDEAETTIRNRIQNGVWNIYSKILPDTQFSGISIDENYRFTIESKQGQQYDVGAMAVGELKTLALSLICTLSNDIGYSDTPLFIDNLFGGIEKSHFSEIARSVEQLSEKKQIFITYLYYKEKSDPSEKIAKYFSPAFVKQEFSAVKNSETGICNLIEEK